MVRGSVFKVSLHQGNRTIVIAVLSHRDINGILMQEFPIQFFSEFLADGKWGHFFCRSITGGFTEGLGFAPSSVCCTILLGCSVTLASLHVCIRHHKKIIRFMKLVSSKNLPYIQYSKILVRMR